MRVPSSLPSFNFTLLSTGPWRLRTAALALLGLSLVASAPPAAAGAPESPVTVAPTPVRQVAESVATALVSGFYDTLLSAMKDGPSLGFAGRVTRLTPAITKAFDLASMTRIASGAQWAKLTPEERTRLTDAFARFSVANYAANFDNFSGERFEVLGEAPAPMPGAVIVRTRLVPGGGDPVELNYLVRPAPDGGLRILDVYVNGTISELASRRSEFASVLNRDGAPGLLDLLETKVRTLAAK